MTIDTKIIRKLLKESEPALIKLELLPELWFKEDEKETEYWIFFYAFCYRFSDDMISQRLGYYTRKHVYNRTLKIIKNNYTVISRFLQI